MNKFFHRSKWTLVSIGSLLVMLFLWKILTSGTGLIKPLYFPSPEGVWAAITMMNEGVFYHAGATLIRVVVSWFIGSAIGVITGLILAKSKWTFHILNPIIEALRPVPPVALIPLVLIWFGVGDSGKIFLSALACFMVMVVNTIVASGNVPPVYLQASETLGATPGKTYRTVVLPAIIPEIMSGARIGIALSFAVTVAVEFMGAKYGVGYLIMQASRTLNTEVVILGTIIIGIEAFLLERLLKIISSKATKWTENPN